MQVTASCRLQASSRRQALRDSNCNRVWPTIRGVYGPIPDLTSAAWRAAACRRSRSGTVPAADTSVGEGRTRGEPARRAGGMVAHAERPHVVKGHREASSRGGRGVGSRAWRCARIWSTTDASVMKTMIRFAPWQSGHARGWRATRPPWPAPSFAAARRLVCQLPAGYASPSVAHGAVSRQRPRGAGKDACCCRADRASAPRVASCSPLATEATR